MCLNRSVDNRKKLATQTENTRLEMCYLGQMGFLHWKTETKKITFVLQIKEHTDKEKIKPLSIV